MKQILLPDKEALDILNQRKNILSEKYNQINSDIKNSLYYKFNDLNNILLFKYFVLFIIIFKLGLIIKLDFIKLTSILIAIVIIYLFYDKDKILETTDKKVIDFKLNSLYPQPKHIKNHDRLINYLYSIKDFRPYNTDSYDKMIQCIDNLLKLYNDIIIGINYTNHNIDIMIDNKKKAVNYLHSIIYNIPETVIIVNKHSEAIKVLIILLDSYIHKCIDISNNKLEKNGYNISSKYYHKNEISGFEMPLNNYDLIHFNYIT